jgi:hypothetical protein
MAKPSGPDREGLVAPEDHAEVVGAPQEPYAEARTEDAMGLPEPRNGKPRPAKLLQQPSTEKPVREAHEQ